MKQFDFVVLGSGIAGLSFACMNVFVKVGASDFSAIEMVFYRSLLTLLLSYVVLRMTGRTARTANYRFHFQRGLAGVAALILYYYGIVLLPLANAVRGNLRPNHDHEC